MANVLSDAQQKIWSRNAQMAAKQNLVARLICSFAETASLRASQSVYRPSLNRPSEGAVGADGSYTPSDITASKQELVVDQWRHASVFINDKDAAQISLNYIAIESGYAGDVLGERLDRVILAEYVNADYYVDTDTLSKTNVASHLLKGINVLKNAKCERGAGWAWVVDPEIDGYITEKYIDSGFNQADSKLVEGSMIYARPFLGTTVLVSNGALSWTGEVKFTLQPGNGETVVINGVTFTAVTSIGSTAGNFLRGADADASGTNLAALINAPSTTNSTQVALSTDGQSSMSDITASYNATTNILTLTSKKGRITLSHTMAGSGNGIQNMILHTLLLKRGAIDLVFQKDFKTEERPVSRTLGKDIVTSALYGYKTFDDGQRCMCDVRVTTQANSVVA